MKEKKYKRLSLKERVIIETLLERNKIFHFRKGPLKPWFDKTWILGNFELVE